MNSVKRVGASFGFARAVMVVSLAVVLTAALMPFAGSAAYADSSSQVGPSYTAASASPLQLSIQKKQAKAAKKNGWQSTAAGKRYYRKGEMLVGLQKIGSKRYYFSGKGIMRTTDVTVGGATFYIQNNGEIIGAKVDNTYHYGTLKPMTKADAYDFETYIRARSIIARITSSADSDRTKLWKAFCWVRDKSYAIHQDFNPHQQNWPAIYARYHFDNRGGDCHSDGAAFAYLAAAIGYPADVCIDSWGTGYAPSHCWAMIGNTVYDPLFYESKGSQYYGATSGTYETSPTARFRVPACNPSHNASAAVSKALLNAGTVGLKKAAGGKVYYFDDGKKVTSAWKTVNGKRYYFKRNGAAATGLKKIGNAFYVFNRNGVLQNSAKAGLRVVKVKGAKGAQVWYQVNKAGRAVAGWSKDHTMYANGKGVLCRSTWSTVNGKRYFFTRDATCATLGAKVNGVYYVFDEQGVLQSGKVPAGATTAIVRIGEDRYRVDAQGRAVASEPGEWEAAGALRFDEDGLLLTGVRFVDGAFYAADSAGAYQPALTGSLNAAIDGFDSVNRPALGLRTLLGAPDSAITSANCNGGQDGLWVYPHFSVITWRPDGLRAVSDLSADELAATDELTDSTGAFEKVVSITAK